MKFYLSGGMEYKTDAGKSWREYLTEELSKLDHGVVDPIQIECDHEGGDHDIQKDILNPLKRLKDLTEFRDIVRMKLIRRDMIGLQDSDALVILYDESVQRGAGSLSECWEAFREGKPVYVVSEFDQRDIASWLLGESCGVFVSFRDFLDYVTDHDLVAFDIKEAVRSRDEVLEGVYPKEA